MVNNKIIAYEECSTCEFKDKDSMLCECSKLFLAFHNLIKDLRLTDERRYCKGYLRIIEGEKL